MTVIINGSTGITNVNGSAAAPAETGTDTDTGIVYGTNTLSLATGGVAAVTLDSSQNMTIPQATAAASNNVSLPPYLSFTGFGWNTSLGSSAIGGRISLTGTYSSPTFGQVSPSLSFSTQDSNGSMTQRAQVNAYGIGLGNGTVPSSGTGITFPASQSASSDANTLDDYEEGTWTPTDVSGAGLTFTTTFARYTKIGNQVTITCQTQFPSTANGSPAKIGGIPFVNGTPNQPGSILSLNANAQKNILYDTSVYVFPVNSVTQAVNSALSTSTVYISVTYLI